MKVLDFGLAKEPTDDSNTKLSQAATLLGTPYYMAPEAILGKGPVDARVDIRALAIVVWDIDAARGWWRERGKDVERRVRAEREERERQPSDVTVEVDPLGRNQATPGE